MTEAVGELSARTKLNKYYWVALDLLSEISDVFNEIVSRDFRTTRFSARGSRKFRLIHGRRQHLDAVRRRRLRNARSGCRAAKETAVRAGRDISVAVIWK